MKSKKLVALCGSICLALILVVLPVMAGCKGAEEVVEEGEEKEEKEEVGPALPVIKVLSTSETPSTSATNISFRKWMENWQEATPNHDIQVEYHYGGEIFPGAQGVEAMATGSLDIGGAGTTYYLAGFLPEIGIFDIPVLWISKNHVRDYFTETPEGRELVAKLDAKGLHTYYSSAFEMWMMFLIDKKVTCLEDLAGMRFRTMQSPVMVKALELLGTSPVVVATAELTFAMQTGMMEGMITSLSPPYITYLGYLDYGKTMLAFPISMTSSMSACSAMWYNALPDEVREAFDMTCDVYIAESWDRTLTDQGHGKEMFANAMPITRLSDEEYARWDAALKPLYDEAREKWGAKYIDKALETRKDYWRGI